MRRRLTWCGFIGKIGGNSLGMGGPLYNKTPYIPYIVGIYWATSQEGPHHFSLSFGKSETFRRLGEASGRRLLTILCRELDVTWSDFPAEILVVKT